MYYHRPPYVKHKTNAMPKATSNGITYPMLTVVAAALIAFKQNGNKIEKYDTPAYTPAQSDPSGIATPRIVSNKAIIVDILRDSLRITQADLVEAQEIVQYIQQQVMMNILKGKTVSNFMKDLAAAFELIELPMAKVGLMVYAPNTYFTGKTHDVIAEKTTELKYTSQPLGHVGEKVTVNFTMLRTNYLQALDCHSVYGHDDVGNLVSFLTKHNHLVKSMSLTGKVKQASVSTWNDNAIVTQLNYVKAVKLPD